ncbi:MULTISPECIES: UvrD-helicase domain-containing protein [Prochlorococcus]|uniref:UvrD-helicase domain-containing protein n=1 Tax=Prochlorococcus TaxID=1218 RepID=UPI000533B134|nr:MULTISPECIES: UvrD-helicase domain-containing protein [Prochlorococcus]KGG12265.1 Exodeoxyribonuclease V beta chain [Prochlorococcus sp. MIT 0601]
MEFNPNTYPLTPGLRLLEASAGTGKTFSIAHLVLRLLTEGEHSIDNILVVSFTKATAAEIKSRISNRIISALHGLESIQAGDIPSKSDEVLREWLGKCSQNSDKCMYWANLLLEALANIEQSDITTIHGFCRRTLQREAIDNGNAIELKALTDEENKQLIIEIVCDYWEEHVLSLEPKHLQGIEEAGISIKSLAKNLMDIDQDQSLAFVVDDPKVDISKSLKTQFQESFHACWQNFVCNWKKDGMALEKSLQEVAKSYRGEGVKDTRPYTPNPRKNRCNEINEWILSFYKTKEDDVNNNEIFYKDIRAQKLIKDYYHPQNLYELEKKLSNSNSFTPSTLQESIADLWEKPAEIVWNHSLSYTFEKLKSIRHKRQVISYGEQLKLLDPESQDHKSKNKSILSKLRIKYKVILIDEFQDTDAIQWRIFREAFAKSSEHLLLMVGDPKQAIYKFRGGDLKTYLRAKEEVDRVDSLTTNYRATPELMDCLNNFMKNGLKYSKLIVPELISKRSKSKVEEYKKHCPIEILSIEHGDKKMANNSSYIPTKADVELKIPNIVTNKTLELITNTEHLVCPNDICILVSRHKQAEEIRDSLSKANIPSRLINQGDIFETEGGKNLQLFLDCLSTPSHIDRLKLLTCSKLMRWDAKKLAEASNAGEFDELVLKFINLSENFKHTGITGSLSSFLESSDIANIAERGRLLGDLYQCAHLVQEAVHSQGLDITGAARWLKHQRIKGSDLTSEERRPNSDIAEEAINVLTVHRSKGLQYKVVICPYLWESPSKPKGPLWRTDEKNKWVFSFKSGLDSHQKIYEKAVEDSIEEAERLAYVALTRAECKLIIFWSIATNQTDNPLKFFLFGPEANKSKIEDLTTENIQTTFRLHNLKFNVRPVRSQEISGKWSPSYENHNLSLGPRPKRSLDQTWGRHSYSSWVSTIEKEGGRKDYPKENEEGRDRDQQEGNIKGSFQDKAFPIELMKNKTNSWSKQGPLQHFPRGPIAGECLHRILERIDYTASVKNEHSVNIIKEELSRSRIDLSKIEIVQEGLERVLSTSLGGPLGDIKFRDLNTERRVNELSFDICLSSENKPILSSELVKVMTRNQGERYGIDYINSLKELNICSSGFLTGSIDLIFNDKDDISNSRWWLADWKSNWLGDFTEQGELSSCGSFHYSINSMEKEMVLHHYPLQANLYLVALHRFLKWRLPNYSPQKHLGGYIYVFLRGIPSDYELSMRSNKGNIPGLIIEEAKFKNIIELDQLLLGKAI